MIYYTQRRHPIKTILVLSILLCAIALPAIGELTDADLNNIRLIVREEVKSEITASEVRMKEYMDTTFDEIDASFDSINRNLDRIQIMLWVAIALVVIAGIVNWTYVLKLWRSR